SRLGTRKDVETAAQFVSELQNTAASVLGALDFPSYIKSHPADDKWNLHNEYEKELVEKCYADLLPKWSSRLADSETYLRDNCWAMREAETVQLARQQRGGGRGREREAGAAARQPRGGPGAPRHGPARGRFSARFLSLLSPPLASQLRRRPLP